MCFYMKRDEWTQIESNAITFNFQLATIGLEQKQRKQFRLYVRVCVCACVRPVSKLIWAVVFIPPFNAPFELGWQSTE